MFNFFKLRGNALVTPKEKAIQNIADQLISWSKYSDRKEILTGVLSRVFTYPCHIHRNPYTVIHIKKEA